MWLLVGRLIQWALAQRTGLAVGGTVISLQGLRDRAAIEAGASDIQALDEAARTAARMLGLDGSQVLWPMDRLGNKIAPKYFHVDLLKGRGWFTSEYNSGAYVRALKRRGRRYTSVGWRNMRSVATALPRR